ncbi:hypothetical protein [Rhizobium sp. Leaf453]|uniref:hypothetical protein n=1 Tax=Rhizobium sp. Leaf453 TaxID=1736380 RepID=UPI000714818A|nr:hypothetical protein [Rhizobium sp. Leaf453]KQT96981.1 hypothetical protein ASG68_08470 [Rhizobium sp. Leaf453]
MGYRGVIDLENVAHDWGHEVRSILKQRALLSRRGELIDEARAEKVARHAEIQSIITGGTVTDPVTLDVLYREADEAYAETTKWLGERQVVTQQLNDMDQRIEVYERGSEALLTLHDELSE